MRVESAKFKGSAARQMYHGIVGAMLEKGNNTSAIRHCKVVQKYPIEVEKMR